MADVPPRGVVIVTSTTPAPAGEVAVGDDDAGAARGEASGGSHTGHGWGRAIGEVIRAADGRNAARGGDGNVHDAGAGRRGRRDLCGRIDGVVYGVGAPELHGG